MFKKILSVFLAGVLIHAMFFEKCITASAKTEKQAQRAGKMKARITELGTGSEVIVIQEGGERLRGRIDSIAEEHFSLTLKRGEPPRQINYDRVVHLDPTKLSYRASGQPDSDEVKRVVAAFGKQKNIKLTLTGGKTLQGKIQSIEADHFTVKGEKTAETTVAYGDVTKLEGKGFPLWGTVVIAAGVGLGILFTFLLVVITD